jgi:lipopolysaccharide/colanic/teichoic acid biosynthesis glycosyltransferase
MIKRIIDILFSLIGLVLVLPVFIVVSIWIKCDSIGPIFFRQERVGRFGQVFRIFKFRTMFFNVSGAGPEVTVGSDRRITKSGKWLRRSKVDELPQLFNVFLGHMSLVGPRPEVPRFVEYYTQKQREIVLSVRPGITDRASIMFRDENEILGLSSDPIREYVEKILPIKIEHYVKYVENQSVKEDFAIILSTIKTLVRW